ncbi:MAG: VWA domain-containing protein [Mycobacteriales bacterium]|nr:VWA domain-containing protein [Mycobacteriales bacterium]
MHLSTRLDCDLVAVETADELTLLVELTAPTPATTEVRQPATLQVVLDRSGSMAGDRLKGAKTALLSLVDRLDPSDNFGLVAFDGHVEVVVPAGALKDKERVKAAIAAVDARGNTDLSAGYLRGLQEARRVAGPAGATVLIVSDGHANAGVTDPDQLGKVAVEAQSHRVTTSTLGFGLGYDETLLSALARGGAGNELFAEEADTAVALISGEVDGLLTQVAQAASLRVTWTRHVAGIQVLNDLPVVGLDDGAMLELGSFYSGETRKLLVKLQIPAIAALGLTQVATLEFTHVSLPDLVQHVTTVPVHVNVVPGDQAAGRIPDPQVRSEALFQQTQQAKRESSKLLSQGRLAEASRLLQETSGRLRRDASTLPAPMAAELLGEADLFDALDEEARVDSSRAAKISSYSATLGSRNRGRQTTGGRLALRFADDAGMAPVLLEEWEVQRLRRLLPRELAEALRSSSRLRDAETADAIADVLGDEHPLRVFFRAGAGRGGFTVGRA